MVRAIVGANWGDEGKGKITDMLAENSDIVIRFQGGANAGHTIINNYGKFALHLFSTGRHGLSLADENWAKGHFENNYTYEQDRCLLAAAKKGELTVTDDQLAVLEALAVREYGEETPVPEIAAWPQLALTWLAVIL